LKDTKSVIIRSAVWAIMTNENFKPQDLNFSVPQSTTYYFDRLKLYLCVEGTTVIYEGLPMEAFKSGVEKFLVLKNKQVRDYFF
jgi:hypothetical protein